MKHSLKSLIGFGAILVSMAAVPASAETPLRDNIYVGASGDLTWLRHSDMGGGANVALGYRMRDVRLEAEVGYHGADGSGNSTETHYLTYMGNVYYDFNNLNTLGNTGWHVAPYIGAGLGDAAIHYGNSSVSGTFHHHNDTFAYQGMAGLTFVSDALPKTDWTLGYRYLGTDEHNLQASNIEAGVHFHF